MFGCHLRPTELQDRRARAGVRPRGRAAVRTYRGGRAARYQVAMAEHTRLERPMPTLSTTVDPRAPSYVDTRQALLARLDELDEAVAAARGRYPTVAHERVELLLDRDAPLLELCPIAGWGTESRPGAGIVGGIGRIEGAESRRPGRSPTGPVGRRAGPVRRRGTRSTICSASVAPTRGRSSPGSWTAASSTSSSRGTAPGWSPVGASCTGTRSVCSR